MQVICPFCSLYHIARDEYCYGVAMRFTSKGLCAANPMAFGPWSFPFVASACIASLLFSSSSLFQKIGSASTKGLNHTRRPLVIVAFIKAALARAGLEGREGDLIEYLCRGGLSPLAQRDGCSTGPLRHHFWSILDITGRALLTFHYIAQHKAK